MLSLYVISYFVALAKAGQIQIKEIKHKNPLIHIFQSVKFRTIKLAHLLL